jgi:hypothetical protein
MGWQVFAFSELLGFQKGTLMPQKERPFKKTAGTPKRFMGPLLAEMKGPKKIRGDPLRVIPTKLVVYSTTSLIR